jgi:Reverse transcriptase (RNA-dependent DNA polymerase)
MEELSLMGAMIAVPRTPSFLSTFFLVKKPNGTWRAIFNLKPFNKAYLEPPPFHLPNIVKVCSMLRPDDLLCSIDLKNAYYHIPIAQEHWKFLRFVYKDQVFAMTCLPFGLSVAPRVFTLVSTWFSDYLRSYKIRCCNYLDDWLFMNPNRLSLCGEMTFSVEEFIRFGWHISFDKSELIPQEVLTYLGVRFHPRGNSKWLTDKQIEKLGRWIVQFLTSGQWSREDLEKWCGHLAFASQVVPLGRLRSKWFQIQLNQLSKDDEERLFPIADHLIQELGWWQDNLAEPSVIFPHVPTQFVVTDASDFGCSAVINGQTFATTWRPYQMAWHINEKELFAVTHFLKLSLLALSNSVVQIQSDNTTVIACLSKEGSTKSWTLNSRTRKFLILMHQHNITLIPVYIPSIYNCLADAQSRGQATPEWTLGVGAIQQVVGQFGPLQLDLFASHQAHVCHRYVSLDAADSQAVWVNAFSRPWEGQNWWIFPPPFEIPRVISHLKKVCRGTFLLVTPQWLNAFWRPELQRMCPHPPLILLNLHSELSDTRTGRFPVTGKEIELIVWRVSLQTGSQQV